MVLVKMSLLDRDERGDHRIPILMNYLSASLDGIIALLSGP